MAIVKDYPTYREFRESPEEKEIINLKSEISELKALVTELINKGESVNNENTEG